MNKRQAKKQEKTQSQVPNSASKWLNGITNNNNTNHNNSLTSAENVKLKRKLNKEKHENLKYKNRIKNQLTKKNKAKSKGKNENSKSNESAEIVKLKREIQKERAKRRASLAKKKKEQAKAKKQWQEKFKKIATLQWNCAIQLGTLTKIVGLESVLGYDSRTDVIKKLLDTGQDTILKEHQVKHKDPNTKLKFRHAMRDFLNRRSNAIKRHEVKRDKVREVNKKNRKRSKSVSK